MYIQYSTKFLIQMNSNKYCILFSMLLPLAYFINVKVEFFHLSYLTATTTIATNTTT